MEWKRYDYNPALKKFKCRVFGFGKVIRQLPDSEVFGGGVEKNVYKVKGTGMKAKVNKELCISCGTCVSMCEKCFKFGEDGKSEFIEGAEACDLEAIADACPTAAIEIVEEKE